jgi:hypothetical protein
MKLSDEKVIEFLSSSPLKSFAGMLDALRYLDGVSIPHDAEFELPDEVLGDDTEEKPNVRVPEIRGIPANELLAFAEYAHSFDIVKRRPLAELDSAPQDIRLVFCELTPSGRYVLKILEALTDASSLPLS